MMKNVLFQIWLFHWVAKAKFHLVATKLLCLVSTEDILYMVAYPVVCVGHAQVLELGLFQSLQSVGTAGKVQQQTPAFVLQLLNQFLKISFS